MALGGAMAQWDLNVSYVQQSSLKLQLFFAKINPTIPSHTGGVFIWMVKLWIASEPAQRGVAFQLNQFFTFWNYTPEETSWHYTKLIGWYSTLQFKLSR